MILMGNMIYTTTVRWNGAPDALRFHEPKYDERIGSKSPRRKPQNPRVLILPMVET